MEFTECACDSDSMDQDYLMDETCPSSLASGSPNAPRTPYNLMNESYPSQLVGSPGMGQSYRSGPSSRGARSPGNIMNETCPSLASGSPRSPYNIMDESYPSQFVGSPGLNITYDVTPSIPKGASYRGNIMNETCPSLASGTPSGPRYQLMNESRPPLASASPMSPRYAGNIMNESPPSMLVGSPIGFRYPGNIMNESYPTFASGVSPPFRRQGISPGRNVQHRTLPSGTSDIFASPGSDFLASGGSLGFGTPSWPQMSNRYMPTPTDSLLVSGGSLRGSPSPPRAVQTRRTSPEAPSPQAHSRNQIALPSDSKKSSPPCPCPDEKIQSITKRSFSPASVKEARNNISESIESHLKKEEPLEFDAVVNSVKNYQALRRQVMTGNPGILGDVGPYTTFQQGVGGSRMSSPQGPCG